MQRATTTLGAISVGTSERDSLVAGLQSFLPPGVEIVTYGALDGMTDAEIAALAPAPGARGIVSAGPGGREVLLDHDKITPLVQRLVARAEADGVAATVVMCGAGWKMIARTKPLVDPGAVFPAVITALAGPQKLGVIKPSPTQIAGETAKYEALGVDVVVTAVSPYAGHGAEAVRAAGRELAAAGVQLVWMTCVGFEDEYRTIVAAEVGVPVILARPLLGRVLAEVMATAAVPALA